MTPKDDLFPFPPQPPEAAGEPSPRQTMGSRGGGSSSPAILPPFFDPANSMPVPQASAPENPSRQGGGLDAEALKPDEIRDIRRFLSLFGNGWIGKLGTSEPAGTGAKPGQADLPKTAPSPVLPSLADPMGGVPRNTAQGELPNPRETLLRIWAESTIQPGAEVETRNELAGILGEISDDAVWFRVFSALTAVFPLKGVLRHGTPDQKLFTLVSLGDRFFQSISGLSFPQRKSVIKAVGRYFSEIAEGFSFLSGELEAFNHQLHERVEGASSGGRTVREMRGFLVVRRENNQLVRLGRVLT